MHGSYSAAHATAKAAGGMGCGTLLVILAVMAFVGWCSLMTLPSPREATLTEEERGRLVRACQAATGLPFVDQLQDLGGTRWALTMSSGDSTANCVIFNGRVDHH